MIEDILIGDSVRFLNANGYPGDKESAAKILKTGIVYTCIDIDIYSYRTDITLDGVPDRVFNSVMFEVTE